MLLDSFRRGVSRFLVFLLFSVLILSFALWGIPNFTREVTQSTIARVGGQAISAQELQQLAEQQRTMLSQEVGQTLTRENARIMYKLRQRNMSADLERDILMALIDRAAIDRHAEHLGLSLSEASIVEAVRTDPSFQSGDKQFNRALFDERLRQVGFTHQRYFAERRKDTVRDMLADALRDSAVAPESLINILHRHREETRTATYAALDPATLPAIPDPEEAKLEAYYETVKTLFSEPERRRITAVLLTREKMKELAAVPDADVRGQWERNRSGYDIPERRRWQQISYKTKGEAEAAAKEIAGGRGFLMVALDAMGAQGRLDQGLVSRREIPDTKLAAAVFQATVGKTSDPIETKAGFQLVKVVDIQPARTRTFEEVAPEIRAELEQTRQTEIVQQLNIQVDELKSDRKALAAIGKELKLDVIDAPSVDRTGKAADGKPAITHPDAERIVSAAFGSDRGGGDRDDVELSDAGKAWLEVGDIVAAKVKPFKEVVAEVKTLWLENERRKALLAAAEAVVKRINAGEKIEDIAAKEGWKLETTAPFKRAGLVPGLSPAGVRQAFALPAGSAGSAETNDGKSRTVFVVREIKTADAPTAEESERLRQELRGQYQGDALSVYVSSLRDRYGYTIDEAVYKRAIGGDLPQ